MYHEHFGLDRAPFRITPDTELFYPGGGRGEVLEALVYAVTSGEGIVKVTGEVGTGKTMLCRMLEVRLPPSVEVVYIANPSLSPEDILHAIALEMNLPVDASAGRLQVMHALQQRLLQMHAQNRRVVVFVEEAQGMPMATLEEIRLLSNLETQRDKLLQIVLFGQPELDDALDRSNIRQLRERITHSFRLEPLNRNEVREYVRFRMRAVGYRGPDVFKEGAYRQLARASEGLVRRINILSDKALLAAFADDTHEVLPRHMRIAIEDGSFSSRPQRRVWWLGGIAALLLAAVGSLYALDGLPWQQWMRQVGLGDGALVVTAGATPPTATASRPAPVPPPANAEPVAPPVAPVAASSQEPAGVTDKAGEDTAAAGDAGAGVAEVAASAVPARPAASAVADSTGLVGKTPGDAPAATASVVAASAPPQATMPTAQPAAAAPVLQASMPATVEPPIAATAPAPAVTETVTAVARPPAAAPAAPAAARRVEVNAEPAASPVVVTKTVVAATSVVGETQSHAPTPPAAPSPASVRADNRLLAERFAVTESWLRSAPRGSFCIQLLLADVARQDSLEEFLRRMQALGTYNDIHVYETKIGARTWFGVLYGEFASFDQARQALNALPEELKRHKPFIRNVRDIVGQG